MKSLTKTIIYFLVGTGVLVVAAAWVEGRFATWFLQFGSRVISQDFGTGAPAGRGDERVWVEGLEVPWEIAWLPDDSMLITERPGRLLHVGSDRVVVPVAGVEPVGEGGLLGLALHPDFAKNRWVYMYLTTRADDGDLVNRVERYELIGTTLHERTVILDDIPGGRVHDGGRIAFGPDGLLYVTTGDAGIESAAQDQTSLAGKILRVTESGEIPANNPFGTVVYSYGHRNVQGLAWDAAGRLWATEHGRSGVRSGYDEINLIMAGANYGWPIIQGDQEREGMVSPVVHSGANDTWAPASVTIIDDTLIFAGLRGAALYAAHIAGDTLSAVQPYGQDVRGRLRIVRLGPDGWLYVGTSNRDGRGTPREGDDKIFRIRPQDLP